MSSCFLGAGDVGQEAAAVAEELQGTGFSLAPTGALTPTGERDVPAGTWKRRGQRAGAGGALHCSGENVVPSGD